MPSLERLQSRLGIAFADERLLQSALTHRSFLNERPAEGIGLENGERLEFLGDAILTYLAAALLFRRYPGHSEGELTGLRAALVKTGTLASFARELGLGWYLRLTKGEERSGARERDALLADTFESLVAAIYLDQGLVAAETFARAFFERQLAGIEANGLMLDYKSRLQQRVQAEQNITPRYRLVEETGQDPQREYTFEVLAGDQRLGVGAGMSKQAAQQAAAQAALAQLDG